MTCPHCTQEVEGCWVCQPDPDPDLAAAVDAVLTPSTCPRDTEPDQWCPHDACWVRPRACRASDRTASEETQ